VRTRTARVMTTLMRNGRDRRSENPSGPPRYLSACYCLGPISGSHQGQRPHWLHRDRGKSLSENRPNTWLHPNASQNVRFLLHRGRRPYMAQSGGSLQRSGSSGIGAIPDIGDLPRDRVNFHWADSIFSSYGAIACKGRAPGRAPVSTLGSYEELVRAAGFQRFPQLNIKSPTKLFYAARPRSRARQRSVVGRSLPFAVDRRNPGSIRGSICG